MKRWLVLLLIVCAANAHAKDRQTLLQDVRKLSGDNVAPFVHADTTLEYYLNEAVIWVGTMGLAVTYIDTITLTDGVLVYYLTPNDSSRVPLEIHTALRLNSAGKMQGVPRISPDEFWRKSQEQMSYMLVDTSLMVTDKLSEEAKLVVWFTGSVQVLRADNTDCNIPDMIEPAVSYQAAGYALMATRTEPNMSIGLKYLELAEKMLNRWIQVHRLNPTDSLGIIK